MVRNRAKLVLLHICCFVVASGFSPSTTMLGKSTGRPPEAAVNDRSLFLCGASSKQSAWVHRLRQQKPSYPKRAGCGILPVSKRRHSVLGLCAREMDDLQPDEHMVEKLVERLEASLDAAVKEERYSEASALRDELSRMHMDDTSAVLKTNSDFYKAFSSKNIDLMGRVWHNSPHVQCIHPGAKPLLGYEDIVKMWRNMFQAKDKVFNNTGIVPDNVRVQVRGTSAFVTCTEEVRAPGVERRMLATNVFRKYGEQWLLVHHHASQATVRPAGIEDLLQGASGATRVIRIDGSSLSQGGSGQTEDFVDEIVRALQGAMEDEKGKTSGFDIGDGNLMHEMLYMEEEDSSEDERGGSGGRRQDTGSQLDVREDGQDEQMMLHERELMDGVTERTVEALRRLAKDGRISRDNKRRLLTDVIEHHQEGESASEVEIAYELLVMRFVRPDGEDAAREDELLEDFADQCKVLAKKLC
mmetsp:Transcript_19746/g.40287  ORF Transcript_19746/g.40287 Transcript_19746/m.40287 type:complete len:470 (-) Transcript_19746:86-1495(-)